MKQQEEENEKKREVVDELFGIVSGKQRGGHDFYYRDKLE